ncbi:lysylphosphatidylglycerol synthase transmembrane domain-containing protein [Ileibacterium valens]|uniref:lysylphosphatidylglycerol synthase transmembrane domain-containing protein n=1 Tax=Ileibacterium valens TaxID=1862668 RepID=UPI00272A41D7|nr:lysylphosphatidylglycerol synthase transmembrane domain-containing protein [Ileibacterium valens]
MKLNKKYLFNIVLILALTFVAMYFDLKDDYKLAMQALERMNTFNMILVLSWGLLFTMVWGISYQILGAKYKKNYSLLEGINVAFIGNFFAGITPSSTGGQIGQIYVLKKQGISYSDGASLLWADFIIYQTTMMIYVTILFALRFTHYVNLSAWFWIVFAGYLMNVVVIVILYTIAIFPVFYLRLIDKLLNVVSRFKFFKKREAALVKTKDTITRFTKEIKHLSQDRVLIVKCMLVNIVRLSLHFSLPYFVARGIGIDVHLNQFVDVMALSSFVTMANSFIPLPGASGGTEVVFSLLFRGMFGALTGAVLLLWRISSYYIPMIAGALIFIVFKNRQDHQPDSEDHQDSDQEDPVELLVEDQAVIKEEIPIVSSIKKAEQPA